ncbi:MAG: hypothetical protein ACLU38_10890 [Dysosmobacter sp.]
MPIQVWLARMERSLTEQEYGDMMALLPDARRERLENCRRKSTRRCCAPIFCCGWRCGSSAAGGIFPDRGR